MKKEPIDDLRLLFLRLIAEETLLKARKAELLNLLADENIEMRDSALVLDADARELIAELHGVGCRFMTVEGQPRFYYPADTEAGLVQRVASLVGGRDALSKMFRRLAREEAA